MDRKRFVIEPAFQDSLCIISVDTYHKMLDYIDELKKTELIEGFIVQKMTKNAKHSNVQNYWIVNIKKQEVDVYTDNQNCKFIQNKTYTNSESIPIFSEYLELRTIWR